MKKTIDIHNIEKLQLFIANIKNNNVKVDNGTWLDHLNSSQAFLVCIGAGPWKINRRVLIQTQALQILGKNDLLNMPIKETFKFPLIWQQQKIQYVIKYLQAYKITMEHFVKFISNMHNPTKLLYEITHTKNRAKVLDLFIRDYLKAPAFPIDRWVARKLKEYNFPQDENYMIELCKAANLDVNYVARAFVSSGNFTGNSIIQL